MKMEKAYILPLVISSPATILLAACTTLGTEFSGESVTFGGDNILRNDVFAAIRKSERYAHNCNDITSVESKIESMTNTHGLVHAKETWRIEACGNQHKYPVSLHEDKQGETDFTVSIIPNN